MSLTKEELMRINRFEYQAALAADPHYNQTELEYLMQVCKWSRELIWEYAPDLAEDAGWPAPDWY